MVFGHKIFPSKTVLMALCVIDCGRIAADVWAIDGECLPAKGSRKSAAGLKSRVCDADYNRCFSAIYGQNQPVAYPSPPAA